MAPPGVSPSIPNAFADDGFDDDLPGWDGRYGIAVATDISEAHPGFMAFVGAVAWRSDEGAERGELFGSMGLPWRSVTTGDFYGIMCIYIYTYISMGL